MVGMPDSGLRGRMVGDIGRKKMLLETPRKAWW